MASSPSDGAQGSWMPISAVSRALIERFGPVGGAVPDGHGKHASVAMILRPGGGSGEGVVATSDMLVIKRAQSKRDPWSGHMAFPGGRVEDHDRDLVHTAVRETQEETGVDLTAGSETLGRLETVHPAGAGLPAITIWPFVFSVPALARAVVNSDEVEGVHWFPVTELMADGNQGTFHLHHRGREQHFPCVRVDGHVIWGLTYRILTQFLGVVVRQGGAQRSTR